MAPRVTTSAKRKPTEKQIAKLAYELYVAEGCPEGRAEQHWRQAEAMLMAPDKKPAASTTANKAKNGQNGRRTAKSGKSR